MPQEAFLRIADWRTSSTRRFEPCGRALARRNAELSRLDCRRRPRGGVRASWRAFYREFDALICPISPTAAFPHDHEPDHERRRLIVNGAEQPYVDLLLLWPGVATLPVCRRLRFQSDALPKGCRSASRSSAPGSRPHDAGARAAHRAGVRRILRRRPLPGPAAKPRSPRSAACPGSRSRSRSPRGRSRSWPGGRMRPRFTAGRFESSLAARLTCL